MRNFFEELRNHPGTLLATFISGMFFLVAAGGNSSVILALIGSAIVWAPVFLTVWTDKEK